MTAHHGVGLLKGGIKGVESAVAGGINKALTHNEEKAKEEKKKEKKEEEKKEKEGKEGTERKKEKKEGKEDKEDKKDKDGKPKKKSSKQLLKDLQAALPVATYHRAVAV